MEAAPVDNDSGADALLQATTLALSRFLTHDEQNREDVVPTCMPTRVVRCHVTGLGVCMYRFRAAARPLLGVCRYMHTPLEGHPFIPSRVDTQILESTRRSGS